MGKAEPLRVILLTVGETTWERQGRFSGRADLPLTTEGLASVRDQFSRLDRPWVGTILHAGDECSAATAAELMDRVDGEPSLKVVEGFHEIDLGLWEGLLEHEVAEKFPTAHRQWQEDPWAVNCPSGEDLAQAQARVVDALQRALTRVKPGTGAVAIILRPVVATLVRLAMTSNEASAERRYEMAEELGFWEACIHARQPLWCSLGADFSWRVRATA